MPPPSLAHFIKILRKNNQLVEVSAPVDPRLEIAEVHRRVIAARGPALLFTNVQGKNFPVITNMFGNDKRVELAFGTNTLHNVEKIAALVHDMPPRLRNLCKEWRLGLRLLRCGMRKKSSQFQCVKNPDVRTLPATTSWHSDGGAFLTLPLVHTGGLPDVPDNLGIYRMQIYEAHEMGMHFQLGKGGGYHLHLAEEQGKDLAVNVYLGGAPALILAALAPLPENLPEFLLCSFLLGKKLGKAHNPHGALDVLTDVEFCLSGVVPAKVRRTEGCFGDHYGYNSLQHDFPVFRPHVMYHKKNAVFPATVVGKPRQEDFFLGDFLQKLLSPLISLAMPAVRDLWSYGECGYHSLATCVVRERYEREALTTAFRVLGEGQLALTKFLLVIDTPLNLQDFTAVLVHILQRSDFRKDLYIFAETAMDTLDYTGGKLHKGSKGVVLGVGEPVRDLPHTPPTPTTDTIRKTGMFCEGCLVLESASYADNPNVYKEILADEALHPFPLLVLVDDLTKTLKSQETFIWTTFTRFNPATDIHAYAVDRSMHKLNYTPPILIDARMKPNYPPELFCDDTTKELVNNRWHEYFPSNNVEMGESDALFQ